MNNHMPELLEELENSARFMRAVIQGPERKISDAAYRLQVQTWAQDTLPDVEAAIKKAKGS